MQGVEKMLTEVREVLVHIQRANVPFGMGNLDEVLDRFTAKMPGAIGEMVEAVRQHGPQSALDRYHAVIKAQKEQIYSLKHRVTLREARAALAKLGTGGGE